MALKVGLDGRCAAMKSSAGSLRADPIVVRHSTPVPREPCADSAKVQPGQRVVARTIKSAPHLRHMLVVADHPGLGLQPVAEAPRHEVVERELERDARRSMTLKTAKPIAESRKAASMPPCTMPCELAWRFSGMKPRIRRPSSIFSNHGPLASAKPDDGDQVKPWEYGHTLILGEPSMRTKRQPI